MGAGGGYVYKEVRWLPQTLRVCFELNQSGLCLLSEADVLGKAKDKMQLLVIPAIYSSLPSFTVFSDAKTNEMSDITG